jgi:hypothetical protein
VLLKEEPIVSHVTPYRGLSLEARRVRFRQVRETVRRTAPYSEEPGYSEQSRLWLYGNVKLLHARLTCIQKAFGPPEHLPATLDEIEREAERAVLDGRVLVCGIHSPAHQRVAVVPLRWGSPRIVVLSGGFMAHLGANLKEEPFRTGRLWRYEWDNRTDLAVSRRAPDKLPTFARHNPTVDRMILLLAQGEWIGIRSPLDLLTPCAA